MGSAIPATRLPQLCPHYSHHFPASVPSLPSGSSPCRSSPHLPARRPSFPPSITRGHSRSFPCLTLSVIITRGHPPAAAPATAAAQLALMRSYEPRAGI